MSVPWLSLLPVRHSCMQCYYYFWTLNVITLLDVQTMTHLQRRVRELHCAFSIIFTFMYWGKRKHVSAGKTFCLWFKVKFIKLSLMNPSLFEIFLSKNPTLLYSTKKGQRTWLVLQKMWQIKNSSTSILCSCQYVINLDVSVEVCIHFHLIFS